MSLDLRPGEIHGLVGENGCGKSTLIKVLAGVHVPDAGEIWIDDVCHRRLHPAEVLRLGIQIIFQDFCLFPNLTVAENIALPAQLRGRRRFVRPIDCVGPASEAVARLGVGLELDQLVASLSVAGQQLVAIARALPHATRLLAMDEPTAALTHHEVARLFEVIRSFKQRGVGILLVSHKIPEILALADRITVLRNGQIAQAGPAHDFTATTLVEAMTGRPAAVRVSTPPPTVSLRGPRLQVRQLSRHGRFSDVNLELQPGEIVGLTGRLGSGRSDFACALFGLLSVDRGSVRVDGRAVRPGDPRAAVAAGLAYVPEDRLVEGLFNTQSVERNLLAGRLPGLGGRCGWLRRRGMAELAEPWIERLRIRVADAASPVNELSGGNQQKVLLGRWLACGAQVLLLNRPTTGVDVAAKAEIHRLLRSWADRGMSMLLISDDLPELLELTQRLLLFHEGRVEAEWSTQALDATELTERLARLR